MAKPNPFMPGTPNAAPAPVPTSTPMPGAGLNAAADSFEVDLTETTDGFHIDDGAYRARCIELEQSISQAGNPMFIWTFVLTEGKFASRELKVWTAITAAAMWKVAECVQALGIGQIGQVVKFKRSDVINRECGVIIEQQEYNNKPRSSIASVISLADLATYQNK